LIESLAVVTAIVGLADEHRGEALHGCYCSLNE
jgi:hypothetical protein